MITKSNEVCMLVHTNPDLMNSSKGGANIAQFSDSDALKKLYSLILAENTRKHPDNPYPLRPKPYNLRKTNDLTKAVMKVFHIHGCHCERSGNEGRQIDNRETFTDVVGRVKTIGSVHRIYGTGTRGTSDLKAIIQGRFVAIEIKNGATGDKQSQAQKDYQKQIEASGGVYLVVSSFGQFLTWFNSNYGGLE